MSEMLGIVVVYLSVILSTVLVAFYFERKISSFVQDRYGPMETGKFGMLQAIADIFKLVQKEDIIPSKADSLLFKFAPFFVFSVVFMGFAVVPLGAFPLEAELSTGILFVLAIVSLDVIGIFIAGWASESKFSLLGAMRALAQIISYEIPLGLVLLCIVILTGTVDLREIAMQQSMVSNTHSYLFGMASWNLNISEVGGILNWNLIKFPFLIIPFVIYYISSLAEANRAPFDIPEAESELIGGFHTEYSGFRFALFFLAEYAVMLLVALVGVIIFLGAWTSPFPNIGMVKLANWTQGSPGTWAYYIWSYVWIFVKVILWVSTQILIRWTYPRLRVDQLMYLSWKVLTPIALFFVLFCSIWKALMLI